MRNSGIIQQLKRMRLEKNDKLYKILLLQGAEMTDFNALINSLPAMVDAEEIKDLNGRIQFSLTPEFLTFAKNSVFIEERSGFRDTKGAKNSLKCRHGVH